MARRHSQQAHVEIISAEDRKHLQRLVSFNADLENPKRAVYPQLMPRPAWDRLRHNGCLKALKGGLCYLTDWGKLNVERDAEGVKAWLLEP